MKYRIYPNTDLSVSEVGFGLWTLSTGWWGEHTDEESIAMLRLSRDLGITFYDTADTYGNGAGEEILHKAFGPNPSDVVYATKFGYDIYSPIAEERRGQRELPTNFSPEFMRFAKWDLPVALVPINTLTPLQNLSSAFSKTEKDLREAVSIFMLFAILVLE